MQREQHPDVAWWSGQQETPEPQDPAGQAGPRLAPDAPGPAAAQDPMDLLGGLRQADPPQVEHRRRRPGLTGDRRVMLVALAMLPVLAVLAVVALLPGGPDDERATQQPAASASPSAEPAQDDAEAAATPSTTAGPLEQVPPDQAAALLDQAGVEPGGDIAGAWSWTDRNGRNALVTASAAGSEPGSYNLRVTHIAGLDESPEVLRVMREPGVPRCDDGEGAAGFTSGSVAVRDLDENGIGEVSVGWTFRCGGEDAASDAKLVLLDDGSKYILRGRGVVGRAGSGGFVPDPRPRSWPEEFLDKLTEQFHQLYY